MLPVDVTPSFIQHCRENVLEFTVMGTPSIRHRPSSVAEVGRQGGHGGQRTPQEREDDPKDRREGDEAREEVLVLRDRVKRLEDEVSRLQGQMQLWPAPPPSAPAPPPTGRRGGDGDDAGSPPCIVM